MAVVHDSFKLFQIIPTFFKFETSQISFCSVLNLNIIYFYTYCSTKKNSYEWARPWSIMHKFRLYYTFWFYSIPCIYSFFSIAIAFSCYLCGSLRTLGSLKLAEVVNCLLFPNCNDDMVSVRDNCKIVIKIKWVEKDTNEPLRSLGTKGIVSIVHLHICVGRSKSKLK